MSGSDAADEAGVVAAVLDYFQGWFTGDAARMQRALHPALAKRALEADGQSLDETTADWMIAATARGVGRRTTDDHVDVTVDDIHGDVAAATVRSAPYREYVHLVRTPDGWRIVNTLYAKS
jgi:hypothetical protein